MADPQVKARIVRRLGAKATPEQAASADVKAMLSALASIKAKAQKHRALFNDEGDFYPPAGDQIIEKIEDLQKALGWMDIQLE